MAVVGRFRAFVWVAAFALGAALAPGRALAQADDVFTARGVAVDATDQTAAAARVKALADGQRRALRQVFERIVLAEDLARQPRLNDRQIEALVQALEVNKERTSSVRYLAELIVRFKPEDLRQMMQQANMRFAETVSRPIVVLPVYVTGKAPSQTAVLWEDANPWRKAWADLPQGAGLVPMIVPIGDLADAEAIDAAGALAGDPAKLGAIASRYRAVETIVTVLTANEDPRSKATLLQLALNRGRPGAAAEGGQAAAPPAPDKSIVVPASASLDERLAAIARDQARAVEDQWKRSHLMRFGEEQRLSLSLPLGSLGELVEARRRLSEVSGVRRVDVTALTRKLARLSVVYSGDPEQLQAAVLQKDMVLSSDPPDWQLKLAPADPAPARPAPAAAATGAAAGPQ
ncbi:MAG: DUF2066 domain-containing protein [Alphaproteobacteria bacterium]|nr:DUF2066 domain-containing protein [Alphaproteobacteria bacterium]